MLDTSNRDIFQLVREAEENYASSTPTRTSKHVEFNLREWIEKIEAYSNARHISGSVDAQGREKPFFDINTGITNIWYRATDIDRKHIRVKATKAVDYLISLIATVKLRDFMRRSRFGAFLNSWGRTLAKYGSAVVKFVEKEGELHAMVVPWNRLIVDPINFDANVKIEVLELTPAQLRKRKGYDQDMVKKLIESVEARESLDGQDKDNVQNFIKLYEVHGEMPLSYLTGKGSDEDTYVQQMHVISFVAMDDDYKDFTLVSGREKDPYMITHLIEEEGRTLSRGAVEYLFEAQWMVNHTAKTIKDQLDLASKLIFQTADETFIGQNVLSAIENGDILIHKPGSPLTQVANSSHDVSQIMKYGDQWHGLGREITSTPDAISGETMPSGTAWRQVEALQQEAHSLFELMVENKGLHIEDMMTQHIIPHIKKDLMNSDEIPAILEEQEIALIDPKHVKKDSVKRLKNMVKESLLKGKVPFGVDTQAIESNVEQGLKELGSARFFKPSEIDKKTWNDLFKDLEWDVEVEVTSENVDKNAVFTTLTTVLKSIATNPAILQDPDTKVLFNKILEETGRVSPLELNGSTPSQPVTSPDNLEVSSPQPQ